MAKTKMRAAMLMIDGDRLIIHVSRNNKMSDDYEVEGNIKLLMMKIMKYAAKHLYYPMDFYNLIGTLGDYFNGDCSESYMNDYVDTTLKEWIKENDYMPTTYE